MFKNDKPKTESTSTSSEDFSAYGVDISKGARRKKKEKNKVPFFKLFNSKYLQKEVNKYGYSFSSKKFYLSLLLAFAVAIGVSLLFKLQVGYLIFVFVVCMLCVPSLLLTSYKNMYESKRFHDVSNYMEHLLYSFRRKRKIITSLEDVLVSFEADNGPMKKLIQDAIYYIQTAETDGDIYREGLDIIENEYSNTRLRNVHNFLIAVENNGGSVEEPVDLLLDERSLWDQRTHEFQKERNAVKRNVIISLCMSLALCFLILFIFSMDSLAHLAIVQNTLVQISSTFVIIASVLMYTKIVNKLSQSWLKRNNKSSDYQILKDYFYVVNRDKSKELKSSILWAVLTSVIFFLGLMISNKVIMVLGAIVSLFCLFSSSISYNLSKKSTIKELEKAFPQWLMELALLLQGNNVQNAIYMSLDTAPVVLRPALHELVEGFERDTYSITPYNDFLSEFDLPEIKSAMRMLYSITTTGTNSINEQIADLIKKQNVLMDKAEKINNEDSLAGFSTLTMVPMLFCIVKSLIDMTVLVFSLFTMVEF